LAIQHRGQDAAGVVTFKDRFQAKKGLGLVREVFQDKHMQRLHGHLAVGHVRYPTVGLGEDTDVQPFWLDYPVGIAMAHNGNVTNFHELKRTYFGQRNIHLGSNCDLEVVLYVFADALMRRLNDPVTVDDVKVAVKEVFTRVKGAYSVVGITSEGMYAFRDPYGIKPMHLRQEGDARGHLLRGRQRIRRARRRRLRSRARPEGRRDAVDRQGPCAALRAGRRQAAPPVHLRVRLLRAARHLPRRHVGLRSAHGARPPARSRVPRTVACRPTS
jgi:asparagine synthetase B (glutamine-hydrolysing)